MPSYLEPLQNEDRLRLRSRIVPNHRYIEDEPVAYTIGLENARNNRYGKTSLKCTVNARSKEFKN